MEFQIKENDGQGCGGYSYFTCVGNESIDELKKMAQKVMMDNWRITSQRSYLFSPPRPSRPTVEVFEYDNINKCRVRKGIKFKVKWR